MRRARTGLAVFLLLPLTQGCSLLFPPLRVSPLPGPPPSEPEAVAPGLRDPAGRYAQPVDALWYDVELTLPAVESWFLGRTRVRLARTGAPREELLLDFTGLHVDSARVAGRAVEWRLEGDRLTLPLEAGAGDTVDVEIHYRGVPDDGLAIAPDLHGYPSVFADNWPNRARFWFPSIDHPSDKAQVTFTVHAPEWLSVVANGTQVGVPLPTPREVPVPDLAPRLTWRWETATAIPTYTMVIGAGMLERRTLGLAACGRAPASPRADGCVEVSWWAFAPDTAHASRVFRRAPEMVEFFTGWIGPYPYEKLANVQSATRFGGMENASAIFYSGASLARGTDVESTVSHEIAHQWFGNSVTPADWSHLWLSEGFATYFGALYFETADGPADFRTRMDRIRQRYVTSEDVDLPLIDAETPDLYDLLNTNNYEKGAWVLHMLRGLLGDEVFRAAVREYYRRHAHGTATSADLRAAIEAVYGHSLEWFFEQWVEQPGFPIFRTSHGYDARRGEAIVVLTQVQDTNWPRFRVPLEIELVWEGGSRRERIDVVNAREVFTFHTPGQLLRVGLDPDGWLLFGREGLVR